MLSRRQIADAWSLVMVIAQAPLVPPQLFRDTAQRAVERRIGLARLPRSLDDHPTSRADGNVGAELAMGCLGERHRGLQRLGKVLGDGPVEVFLHMAPQGVADVEMPSYDGYIHEWIRCNLVWPKWGYSAVRQVPDGLDVTPLRVSS